jgi:hypothetical protein
MNNPSHRIPLLLRRDAMPKYVLIYILMLIFSGCGRAPTPAVEVTQTQVPPTTLIASTVPTVAEQHDDRGAAILGLMAGYEGIIRDGRTEEIATITDSAPVRRFLTSAAAAAPPTEGATHRSYQIIALEERFPDVVEAEFARDDGRHLRLLFRRVETGWVITEPTEAELGDQITLERGTLSIVSYASYPYTDDVVAVIDEAYEQLEAFFGDLPTQPLRVVLKPAFGVGTMMAFDVQGYYDYGSRPQLTVTVPWAISFRHYDPTEGWQMSVRHLVAHELTHFVQQNNPTLASVNRAPSWIAEGLAEFVAAPLRLDLARGFDEQSSWLPFEQADGPSLLALDTLGPKERTIAYVQVQLLIAYLARDDQDDLWAFIEAYAQAPGTGAARLDTALQQQLGTDINSFTEAWEDWVRHQLSASRSSAERRNIARHHL